MCNAQQGYVFCNTKTLFMKIKDIYEFEHNRNYDSDKYTIRFFREGTWWRAYEYSAYLAHNFPNGIEEDKKLLVTKRHYKDLNVDLVVVGLQLKSFEKYFPNIRINDDSFSLEDGYMDVNVEDFLNNDIEKLENCKKIFENWKDGFKISVKTDEKYNKNDETSNSTGNPTGKNEVYKVLHEISDWQISNKTLVESITFLNYIQTKVKKILN